MTFIMTFFILVGLGVILSIEKDPKDLESGILWIDRHVEQSLKSSLIVNINYIHVRITIIVVAHG